MAAERSATETAADRLYRNTEQSAWNTYTNATLTTRTSCIGSIKTPENTYKTAVDTAESAFDTTTVMAYTNYHQSVHALDTAFYAAVSDANDTNFTTTAYFTTTGANANSSYAMFQMAKSEENSEQNNDDILILYRNRIFRVPNEWIYVVQRIVFPVEGYGNEKFTHRSTLTLKSLSTPNEPTKLIFYFVDENGKTYRPSEYSSAEDWSYFVDTCLVPQDLNSFQSIWNQERNAFSPENLSSPVGLGDFEQYAPNNSHVSTASKLFLYAKKSGLKDWMIDEGIAMLDALEWTPKYWRSDLNIPFRRQLERVMTPKMDVFGNPLPTATELNGTYGGVLFRGKYNLNNLKKIHDEDFNLFNGLGFEMEITPRPGLRDLPSSIATKLDNIATWLNLPWR